MFKTMFLMQIRPSLAYSLDVRGHFLQVLQGSQMCLPGKSPAPEPNLIFTGVQTEACPEPRWLAEANTSAYHLPPRGEQEPSHLWPGEDPFHLPERANVQQYLDPGCASRADPRASGVSGFTFPLFFHWPLSRGFSDNAVPYRSPKVCS